MSELTAGGMLTWCGRIVILGAVNDGVGSSPRGDGRDGRPLCRRTHGLVARSVTGPGSLAIARERAGAGADNMGDSTARGDFTTSMPAGPRRGLRKIRQHRRWLTWLATVRLLIADDPGQYQTETVPHDRGGPASWRTRVERMSKIGHFVTAKAISIETPLLESSVWSAPYVELIMENQITVLMRCREQVDAESKVILNSGRDFCSQHADHAQHDPKEASLGRSARGEHAQLKRYNSLAPRDRS
jgi:hypothetical protein